MRSPCASSQPWTQTILGSGRPALISMAGQIDGVQAVDVLADDVQVSRPPVVEHRRIVGEAGPGDVVDERVVPDVDRARGRVPAAVVAPGAATVGHERERDAPGRPFAADAEVLESLADEAEHLVLAVLRLHPVGHVGVVPLQALLVRRQAEEPVVLGQPLQLDVGVVGAVHARPVLEQVAAVAEALVGAVPAFVLAQVDVAVRVGAPDHLVHGIGVVRVRGADEAVGADAERVLGGSEERHHLIDEGLRLQALRRGSGGDVDRVLVGAGQEARVVAEHTVPARDDVGSDDLVQRVQAGSVVGVGDGGGQVEAASFSHGCTDGT